MAGTLEHFTAPVMVLEDILNPDLEDLELDALDILDKWNPEGIMPGDVACEITSAIIQAAGKADQAEEAIKEAYPDGLTPKDYPAAVALALQYFRGI